MFTRVLMATFFIITPVTAMADMDEHASQVFHAFKLQGDFGTGREEHVSRWDLDGWIGGDDNKLWLKAEGEKVSGNTEQSELWALYSRNIDTFWDLQAGIRYDQEPVSTSYFVFGINGLAPYFFETEAHLFVSDDGDVSARLREENDFLLTQQWIIKPYGEVTFDTGFSELNIGLQLRYEVVRKVAPYLDLRHTHSNDGEDIIIAAGLQLIF